MTEAAIDANIRSIADRKIEGVLADRMQKFGYRLADLHSQFAKTGGAGGSGHQHVIRDACKSELRDRFQAVGGMLRSIAINFSLPRSPATAEELKALMRQHVINSTSDLREAIELTKGGSGAVDGRADVTALIEQVLPEAEADIDLFISAATVKIDPTLLRQIQNTVTDLRNTDQPSFERHIRKLARQLHSPGISEITAALTKNTDLNAWFKASGADSSGRLAWPTDRNEEFGIIIKLIDKCAEQPDWASSWLAFKIYGVGNDYSRNLQNLAEQVFVPFSRDYVEYLKTLSTEDKENAPLIDGSALSRKVFIVHGRDEAARETVARFIEKIGFEPIILHERASKGRTIIAKLREEAADIGFAVVLMTPDDRGGKAGEPDLNPRARQNVVFELGFFIGVLGPERVAALIKGKVERPSDFDGVVYIELDDAGGWKLKLGKELEAAELKFDWNTALK